MITCPRCQSTDVTCRTGWNQLPRGERHWATAKCMNCGYSVSASASEAAGAVKAAMMKFADGEDDE